ncbi:unnamed protein product [Symbiodinium microadriaticum]|nr:unnamed protein product [Symbiodinium microadriaticum]
MREEFVQLGGTAADVAPQRVGGHCHAAVIRSDTTAHELLQQVRLQIRADFDDEDLQVWVGDSALPASRTGTLNIAHGTLLTVMRTPFTPGTLRHVTALFTPTAQWCRVDHMPTPPQTYSLALCRGQALDPVCPAFFPWAQTADIVRSVYRLPAEDDKIVVLDNNPILDVHGEPCAQTAIAFSGPGPLSSQDILQPYFLDLRLLGESPKLVYLPVVQGEGIDLPDILAAAQVEIPRHLAGIVLQNSLRGDLQVLQIGVGPDLAHSIFSVCHEGEGTEGAVTASVPGYDQRRPADSHSSGPATHALHELVGPVPERYGQDTGPPTAHEALNLVDADVVAQWDLLPIHTCFLIFVPRFRTCIFMSTLQMPYLSTMGFTRQHQDRLTSQSMVNIAELSSQLQNPNTYSTSDTSLFNLEERGSPTPALFCQVLMWISFAVLKEGYQPERITVQLSVPATPEEAEAALQAARDPYMRQLFPHVTAVLPQPSYGTAVYLAAPIWYPNMQGTCLDLVDLDGRIYATTLPDYISRHELLALVSHPRPDTLRVLVGFDAQQLLDEEPVHLYPGGLVTFLSPQTEEPIPYTIGQLLLMRDAWSTSYSLPTPDVDNAYCLVARGRARLHISDPGAPTRYRDDIATAVGINTRNMRLYAASPPTQDVAEQEVPCRTVIAAYDAQMQAAHPWQGALLDCRPILEDWQELFVTNGLLNVRRLLQTLQDSTPRGWRPTLNVAADNDGLARVRAGQVVIATYVSAPQDPSRAETSHDRPLSEAPVPPENGTHSGSESSASSSNPLQNDTDTLPDPETGAITDASTPLSVFVYSQQYTPEHCRLHLAPDPTIPDVLESTRQVRNQIAQRIFPDLVPVLPQPDPGWVTLIALPAWPYVGTPVLIQVLGPAARRFAIHVPNVLTRVDALILAQCDERAQCHVHLRDTPWPLPEDGAFPVRAGDLITIRPHQTHLPVMRPLAVLLTQPRQWEWPYQAPAYWNAGGWLVTDQHSFHASIAPPPNARVHSEVATVMNVPLADLNVGHAYPPIEDHADAGHTSTSVVVVAQRQLDTHDVSPTAVPYILDLRPLLLPLTLERATDGVIDIAWVYDRVRHRCPPGFCVRIYGGFYEESAANAFRQVLSGAVIRIELHPDTPLPADTADSDDSPYPASRSPAPHSHEGDDASAGQPSSSSSSRPLPDTGGTGRTSNSAFGHHHSQMPRAPCKPTLGYTGVLHISISIVIVILLLAQVGRQRTSETSETRACAFVTAAFAAKQFRISRLQCLWTIVILLSFTTSVTAVQLPSFAIRPSSTTTDGLITTIPPKTIPLSTRAVPTPCRGRSHRDGVAGTPRAQIRDSYDQWELRTLLEVCNAETKHHFFLAATLLDTLEEHFGPPRPDPVTLTLAEQLPLTSFQAQVLRLQQILPIAKDPALDPEMDWLDNDLSRLLHDHKVPLEQRTLFVNVRTWHAAGSPPPTRLRVFTDGSATIDSACQSPCAWAFGVWVPHAGESLLLGYAAGTAAPPHTPFHLGEVDDLPQTSEQLAIAWALIWAVEHAARFSCPLEFMYDCLAAGKGTFGDWRMPAQPNAGGHSALAYNLLCPRQLAQVTLCISHGHISGHAGHLENEYADQLAKQARRVSEDLYERLLPRWPAYFLQHPLRAWGWAAAAHHPDIPALYAFETEADRLQRLDQRPKTAPFPSPPQVVSRSAPIVDCIFNITAVTYNALTMRDPAPSKTDPRVGMRVIGRKALLKDQLAQFKPLLIGLQETRLPDDGMQPDPDYMIYQSAATSAGHYGCSLWISRTVPYAVRGDKSLYLRPEHVNILGYSPRHITACIKAEALRAFVMVCHSPNAYSAPIADCTAFWNSRAQELTRRPAGFDYIILADANARVGSLPTEHVGDCCQEAENPPGEVFHEFLATHQAFLPSTFREVHHGPGYTWVSPGGDRHRIDYIAVPLAWKHFQLKSQVLCAVELLQARDDHYPVLLACEFARQAPPTAYQPVQKRQAARPARPSTSEERAVTQYGAMHTLDRRGPHDSPLSVLFQPLLRAHLPRQKGKVLHRAVRSRLLDVLTHFRPPLQAGAIPGEGIEYISLAAQCFQQYREGRRQPWALVFYDIQAAFYSVVRELIVPTVQSEEGLLRLFHALKIPPQAVSELKSKLETLALLPSLQTSPHLVATVQDLYRGTWFKLSQSALLTITQRGTRPGDPAADAVFGLAMAALLHSIDEQLIRAGLAPEVPKATHVPGWAALQSEPRWGCPAWADDFVQPVDGDCSAQLLCKVRDLIPPSTPVTAILESLAEEPTWWLRLTFGCASTSASTSPAHMAFSVLPVTMPQSNTAFRVTVFMGRCVYLIPPMDLEQIRTTSANTAGFYATHQLLTSRPVVIQARRHWFFAGFMSAALKKEALPPRSTGNLC